MYVLFFSIHLCTLVTTNEVSFQISIYPNVYFGRRNNLTVFHWCQEKLVTNLTFRSNQGYYIKMASSCNKCDPTFFCYSRCCRLVFLKITSPCYSGRTICYLTSAAGVIDSSSTLPPLLQWWAHLLPYSKIRSRDWS